MSKIYILCVDDEPEVLDAVIRDLAEFEDSFPIESAENVEVAREVIDGILKKGDRIGIILCDHVMPGESGVDLLVELQKKEVLKPTRKILLTGQAGLDATIVAVNQASLSHYISKPWESGSLVSTTKKQLAHYFVQTGQDPRKYMSLLDPMIISEAIRKGMIGDS